MEESKTYCLKDYKNKHFWESIGVFTTVNGIIRQVFKCSQCSKIITEKLEEITLVYQQPDSLEYTDQPLSEPDFLEAENISYPNPKSVNQNENEVRLCKCGKCGFAHYTKETERLFQCPKCGCMTNHKFQQDLQEEPKKGGVKIIDAKVVGICSKCRNEKDEVLKYNDGRIIPDKDIACLCESLGECKHNAHDLLCEECGEKDEMDYPDGQKVCGDCRGKKEVDDMNNDELESEIKEHSEGIAEKCRIAQLNEEEKE